MRLKSYIILLAVLLLLGSARGQVLDLGIPPSPPTSPLAREQVVLPRAPVVFPGWFDPTARSQIASSYNQVVVGLRSSVPTGWTGNLSTGNAGTTSQDWKDAVLSRINFMRAMAGVPPTIVFNPTYSDKAQKAAMIMSSNQQLSHQPPSNWTNWTQDGYEAAGNSNICIMFNISDAGCVEGYMRDDGANNAPVGHRRWLLFPNTQLMGTGDIPQHGNYWYSNATWVFDSNALGTRPATRDTYVAWPPRGYVPSGLIPERWSFAYPSANFHAATVTMSRGGTSISSTLEQVHDGYGENTIVWVPNNPLPVPLTSDTMISVTVSNVVIGGQARTFSYEVIVFDPNSANFVSPANGATQVSLNTTLTWSAVTGATSYDVAFGTSNPPPVVANTAGTTYQPSLLQPGVTYFWRIIAKNGSTSVLSSVQSFTTAGATPAPGTNGLYFRTVVPCRVVDTRQGSIIAGGDQRDVAIAGVCGVPSNAQAFSVNVTVVPSGPLGYLTLWPTGVNQPLVSTLNSPDGGVMANSAIVPAGTGGAVSIFASHPTHVIIDINGYFAQDSSGSAFFAVNPCRAVDTRNTGSAISAAQSQSFGMTSSGCGLPAGTTAVSLNATVVPSGSLGYLTLWPTGVVQPYVSTLNAPAGGVVANGAIVPTGAGGAINAYGTNSTHLILDVNGAFAPATGSNGLAFYPITPCRVADTRGEGGKSGAFGLPVMGGGSTRTFPVPASGCGVPSSARAYAMNVTVVPRGSLGYLTLWPSGQSQPFVSTLNSPAGRILANGAIVPAGADGSVSVFVTDTTDVILDINGYFAP